MIINRNWAKLHDEFISSGPFNHIVLDDFFTQDIAKKISSEFPSYDDPIWTAHYHNPLEDKKTMNHWDKFKSTTYLAFSYLLSEEFVKNLRLIAGIQDIIPDIGLHGGGLHSHTTNGKLNIHLDYNIHPKLNLQRKFNIIIYMTPDWNDSWGGGLELWSHDFTENKPLHCEKTISNKFNRAVIFDTTQYSWHGLPRNLNCPMGVVRQSLAVYYVTTPEQNTEQRPRALFAPYEQQQNDESVLNFIKQRCQVQK